jgi:hypothetical protein
MAKSKAIEQLYRDGIPAPLDAIRDELRKIIESDLTTYQSGQAQSKAAKLLAAIDGEVLEEWPSTTPDEPVPDDYWPHDEFSDFEGWVSDGWDRTSKGVRPKLRRVTQGDVDAWRTSLLGPAPWKPGQSPQEPVDDHPEE